MLYVVVLEKNKMIEFRGEKVKNGTSNDRKEE